MYWTIGTPAQFQGLSTVNLLKMYVYWLLKSTKPGCKIFLNINFLQFKQIGPSRNF